MSRHRHVRALDLQNELDDSALDSVHDAFPDATADQLAELESALQAVRAVIGPEAAFQGGEGYSGISDADLRNQLWESYFDVEGATDWALEERSRRANAAKKRAEAKAAKAAKQASRQATPNPSRPGTPGPSSPTNPPKTAISPSKALPARVSALQQDLQNTGLGGGSGALSAGSSRINSEEDDDWDWRKDASSTPVVKVAREKILAEIKAREAASGYRPTLGLVVVGHVDSGKSTLMGRLIYNLPDITQTQKKEAEKNQRRSEQEGKGSFGWAWGTDTNKEERDRGVTIDITHDTFTTPHRAFTLIDAPGHADFVPNMISGAAQADAAFLVVDATPGAFEKGFEGGGQTREHAVLCRSLGVRSVVVCVNKMDSIGYAQSRFQGIVDELTPYLASIGFVSSAVALVPCAAYVAENLTSRSDKRLTCWWDGPTVAEAMDKLTVPPRALAAPLRLPISNVFRGAAASGSLRSGLAISGRLESGILQVGERVCFVPGDPKEAVGVVRALEGGQSGDDGPGKYAVAGEWVTIWVGGVDPAYVKIGCVMCAAGAPISLATRFSAQVVVFDLKYPLTSGASVEVHHQSKSWPAVIAKLESTLDRATGEVIKRNPRMLSKHSSARVVIKVRSGDGWEADGLEAGSCAGAPLESFKANKGMGRIAIRRAGETVAAGIVLEVLR